MCWAAGVTSEQAVLLRDPPRIHAAPCVRILSRQLVDAPAGGKLFRVDISAGGGYTIRRRFWREYLRTPCGGGGEGGCADYLLFLHIQQVVQVRSAICVVSDQKRTAIDRVVVYGFFCVQDRNSEYGTTAQVITFCGVCPCRWHPPAAAAAHIPRRCACPVC